MGKSSLGCYSTGSESLNNGKMALALPRDKGGPRQGPSKPCYKYLQGTFIHGTVTALFVCLFVALTLLNYLKFCSPFKEISNFVCLPSNKKTICDNFFYSPTSVQCSSFAL